jgi:hypothetical protein
MNSLVFLAAMSVKNTFLEILRKPAKRFLYLFLIVFIVGFYMISLYARSHNPEEIADLIWLKGIMFSLVALYVLVGVWQGLSGGNAIFGMSDVNLLFVSPVDVRHILLYGVVRMTNISFRAVGIVLFQGPNLVLNYGLGAGGIWLILAGFVLSACFMQSMTLLIYSLTNGRPARKRATLLIVGLVFLPVAAYCGARFFQTGNIWGALEDTLRSPFFSWMPVMGWVPEGVLAFLEGEFLTGCLFFGAVVFASALPVVYIMFSRPDYYEDVLVAAETAFERKRAIAAGQMNLAAASSARVKAAKTGVGGSGARAIFYKHLRESFREYRLGLWDMWSVLTVLGAIAVSWVIKNDQENNVVLIILPTLMWMQLFTIGRGRGLKELYSHYVYMIPERVFPKIVWSNLDAVFKAAGESAVIFAAVGAVTGEDPLTVIGGAAVYASFSLLLIGVNYLLLRFTGADMTAGLLMFIYIGAVVAVMLPGLISAIIVGVFRKSWGMIAPLGVLTLWELFAAILCFALSRGVLHRCDMPVMNIKDLR